MASRRPRRKSFTDTQFNLSQPNQGDLATNVINFLQCLPCNRSPNKAREGKHLKLYDFQKEIIRGIFKEGVRHALISMPKKLGKSALCAWLNIAHLYYKPLMQPSGQLLILSVGTSQAKLIFNTIVDIIDMLPLQYKSLVRITKNGIIERPDYGIRLKVIANDTSGARLHGYEPTLATIDEPSMMTSVDGYMALKSSNPKLLILASTVTSLPFGEHHWHSNLVKDKVIPDHHFRYYLTCTKQEADSHFKDEQADEQVWRRVTPCLDIKTLDYIREEYHDAKRLGNKNSFKHAHLNYIVPTTYEEVTIATQEQIENCWSPTTHLKLHARCILGLDLAQITDCAFLVLAGLDGVTKSFAFVPRKAVLDAPSMRDKYEQWHDEKHIRIVDDPVISFTDIANHVLQWQKQYNIIAACKDPWLANQYEIIAKEVGVKMEHHNVKQMGDMMGVASKELKSLIHKGDLKINNPCLLWHLQATAWSIDTNLNIRPRKDLSHARQKGVRCDGCLALCNALWYKAQHKLTKKSLINYHLGFLGEA